MEWFNTIFGPETPPMLKIYWGIAVFASVVFIIQMIMTFVGFDADSDASDSDFDASGYHLFTVRSLVNFLLGFGWAGVLFWDSLSDKMVLINIIAVLVGLAFVFLVFFIISQIMKLSADNTFKIEQSVGVSGSVYLRIPGYKEGTGKVQLSVNGTVHELNAQTEGRELSTGSKVKVVSIIDEDSVMVEQM